MILGNSVVALEKKHTELYFNTKNCVMKISILCHTARSSYCFVGNKYLHLFELLLNSVLDQDFQYLDEVEVIFIDARYKERHSSFGLGNHSFNGKQYQFWIKHIDQTTDNPYFKHGLWVEALALNKGIICADGELLMTMADKSALQSKDILSKAWYYYKNDNKFLLLGWKDVVFNNGLLNILSEYDSRYKFILDKGQTVSDAFGAWLYGYSFYSLDAALNVNGYDVAMDCIKGVVDCDFGVRLEGIGSKFIIDTDLFIYRYRVDNDAIAVPVEGSIMTPMPKDSPFKTNVGILLMNQADKRYFANACVLTEADTLRAWCLFREAEVNNHKDYSPEIGTKNYELLMWWLKNQIVYNLREFRSKR